MPNPKWLEWAQRIQALAQSGLAYSPNIFDRERYEELNAIAAEIMSAHSGVPAEQLLHLFDAQAGYATPKLDIRGVVFDQEDRILLVNELIDGGWTLPGGWVDVNEPPSLAVEREVREESGFEVKAKRLLAIYDRNKHGHPAYVFHIYKIFIECELIGGTAGTSIETGGAQFFDRDHLPPLSIARTTLEVLDRLFCLHHNPDRPAEFD